MRGCGGGAWGLLTLGAWQAVRRSEPVSQDTSAKFHRGDHAEIADRLLDSLSPDRDDLVFDEARLHLYRARSGLWTPLSPSTLRRFVKAFAGAPLANPRRPQLHIDLSAANGAATLAGDTVAQEGFFIAAPRGLAFQNGFLAVESDNTLHLRPHARQHRARWAYAFDYDATAVCPRFIEFLNQTFDGDEDCRDRIACIQEFAGISILGLAPKYQRALVLPGVGSNGKSTLLEVLAALPPRGSLASIAPQTWASEYRLAMLAGKVLNIVSELPELELFDTEVVKCVISGDPTTARHIREAPFRFQPIAGHIFSTNRLPRTSDATHGFWRRFLVLAFNNVIADADQNALLASQLLEEMVGITTWALAGASRLLANGRYTVPASSVRALEAWRQEADPVRQFATEALAKLKPDEKGTLATAAYGAYRTWAKENGMPAIASNKFGARLRGMGIGPRHTDAGSLYPFTLGDGAGPLFEQPPADANADAGGGQ